VISAAASKVLEITPFRKMKNPSNCTRQKALNFPNRQIHDGVAMKSAKKHFGSRLGAAG